MNRPLLFITRISAYAIAVTLSATASLTPCLAAPQIQVDEATYNFGDVHVTAATEKIEHVYKIQNSGDTDLVIEKVKTSCGCTTASLSTKLLAPGDSVDLSAKLSLKGRNGNMTKSITIESNDPQSPKLRLELKVNALREVTLQPRFVTFRVDPKTSSAPDRSIVLIFDGDKDYHLTSIVTNNVPFCSIEQKTVREGKEYHILVKLKENAAATKSRKTGKLLIHTDHPDYTAIEVPISYHIFSQPVRTAVSVYPSTIRLPKHLEAGKTYTHALLVRSNRNIPLKVLEIIPPNEHVLISTQSVNRAYVRYAIEFTKITDDMDGKTVNLRAETQDKKEHSFAIPIRLK